MASKPATPKAPAAVTVAAAAPKTAPVRIAPTVTAAVMLDLPLPTTRRGESAYAFHTLTEPGMLLGVTNKTAKQISTGVSNQNKKFASQKMGEGGKIETIYAKKFAAVEVTAEIAAKLVGTPLEGATALIKRTI